jgi:nucleoid-associated protein YgaU
VGSMQQAVLEFDEAVQAPWRPLLGGGPAPRPVAPPRAPRPPASRPGSPRSRVGRSPALVAVPARREPAGAVRRGPAVTAPAPRSTSGRQACPGHAEAPPLRLTARARRLVAVLALGVAVAVGSLIGSLVTGAGGDQLRLAGVSSVVVEPGDTLWSIAASVAGEGDVRDVVDRIQAVNRLSGTTLVPGQVLQLP